MYKSQHSLEAIFEKEKINGSLDLTENFESIFTILPLFDEYHLFIGQDAGFMDSRVIYIWLSNNFLFNKKNFYTNRKNFNVDKYIELLEESRKNNFKDLAYSREPNIGVKK